MIYITGDTHRDFRRVEEFCERFETTKDDILVILGDVGINYIAENIHKYPRHLSDNGLKKLLNELPITMFCIHGNHEIRPQNIAGYTETIWNGGAVFIEPEFPNLIFAKDGEIFNLNNNRCLVIGGAYSIDKEYRLLKDMGWWPDEQPSEEIKRRVEERLDDEKWQVDIVFSHTCPYKYIGQIFSVIYKNIDNSTEEWLDKIEDKLSFIRWYCGHMHVEKVIDKMRFMYNDFIELGAYHD